MPMLKDEKAIHGFMPPAMPLADDKGAIKMPAPTAVTSSGRQTGWQLFDNPVPVLEKGNGGDVEAAALPPARRPSFIDRLLTHRADPNDSRLPTNNHLGRNPVQLPSGRKASGSGLFSVLSGPMIGFSHSLRNNQSAAKELAVIDSDFEGTIGGKDGEIPMAKRIQKNQGRFACDASTNAPSPCFNERPSDHFSPLAPRFSALYRASPHTPGLAGVGATWARRPSMPPLPATAREPIVGGRIASFAELQRQPLSEEAANRWAFQSTIDNWMRESQNAGKPPPSRRESTNSFLTAHSSSTSVVTRKLPEDAGVERMMSIRPRFAPMTTLSSWLKMDNEDSEVAREEDSIFEKYIAAGSEVSAGTDFDRKRGRLWEGPPPYQPSELSQPSPRTAEKNAFASPLAPYLPSRCQEWSVEEEAREEERRQIDRRQAYLLRQKIKAERRLSRQRREQAKHMEAMAGDSSAYVEQRHRMHCILDMEEMYGQSDRATTHFEAEQHRLRLAPSLQSFHAPVLSSGDQIVAQARRQSAPYPGLADRSPVRVYSLSPPESPLTSASETEQSHRRGYFLVQSNRSRSSAHSGSLRSISHGSGITLQRMPDQQRDAHFNMSLRTQRPQQDMDRCISEHDKLTCVDV